jgi:16S rRNA (cytidine1402-2'-O)-methyltransferase
MLERGKTVALITDAGTPGISDPGQRVVSAVAGAGYTIEVVPGPSAVIAALVVSGLPTHRFCFEGFLPRKGAERNRRLQTISGAGCTTALYEAPHRLVRTLNDLIEVCGPLRQVVLVRELTKLHEEIWRGSLGELAERAAHHEVRGEVTLVIAGAEAEPSAGPSLPEARREVDRLVAAGLTRSAAAREVAQRTGLPRRELFQR